MHILIPTTLLAAILSIGGCATSGTLSSGGYGTYSHTSTSTLVTGGSACGSTTTTWQTVEPHFHFKSPHPHTQRRFHDRHRDPFGTRSRHRWFSHERHHPYLRDHRHHRGIHRYPGHRPPDFFPHHRHRSHFGHGSHRGSRSGFSIGIHGRF